jgi:hypothetical protein
MVNRPIATFLRHLIAIVTLGWDFPLLTECMDWWTSHPRVQLRRMRRRAALRYFARLVQLSIRLSIRLTIKVVTLGKFPKRPFLWDCTEV